MTAPDSAPGTPSVAAPRPSSAVDIRPVETPADMRHFLAVPFLVHAGDSAWVPPLHVERRAALDRQRNPFFRHAEVAFWTAYREGRPAGRISAQIDQRAPSGSGSFGMLSAVDDPAVFAALAETAEGWLRTRAVRRITGPLNLSINQEAGLLVEGFDTSPMLLMGHDRPWVARHLEALGYAKAKDLHAFLGKVDRQQPPERMQQLLRQATAGVTLRPLRLADYPAEVRTLADIFNDAWSRNWGFVPLAADEIEHMARQMRPLIRERLVWFTEIDGVPAGFIVCLPNLNEAIRELDGRLLPFGWARLLWRLRVRGVSTARIPLMGIRRRYSSSVLGSKLVFMMINAVREECDALGIKLVETSWILEDNSRVIRIIEALGGHRYKTYRIYEKLL